MSLKVSIITPAYNQVQYIRQTIESVLSQSYDNIEYIIVDGGSNDGTLEIIKEYADKLFYISEPDSGQSNAINKGFRLATGDIVAWLNSDDTYELDAIEHVVEYFERHPDISLIYGEGNIINEDGQYLHRFENTILHNLWMLIYVWDYIMQPTTFFRMSALVDVGLLNEKLNWTMDWDLWLKLSLKYNVAYVNFFLANSREYNATKTSTGGFKRIREIRKLTSHYAHMFITPGCFLFFCDWLSRKVHFNIMKKACLIIARSVLINLPIPDAQHRCPIKTCFSIPDTKDTQVFHVFNDADKSVTVRVYIDNKKHGEYLVGNYLMLELPITNNERKFNKVVAKIPQKYSRKVRIIPDDLYAEADCLQ